MRNGFCFCTALILVLVCCGLSGCQQDEHAQQALAAGEQSFAAKNYEMAIARASGAISLNPELADAYYLRGRAIEERTKPSAVAAANDLSMAKIDYLKGLTVNPSKSVAARLHAQLGNIAFNQNDYPGALTQWTQALPDMENDAWKARVLYLMGVSQQRLGRFGDADFTFGQVISQFPDSPSAAEAKQRQGVHGFQVQVGAYSQLADAGRAASMIQSNGAIPVVTNERGRYIVRSSPTPSYAQAEALRQRLLSSFADAILYP